MGALAIPARFAEPKMMIITHKKLAPGYQMVQGCHALADYAFQHPEQYRHWHQASNSLICLAADNLAKLQKIQVQLQDDGIPHSAFLEPDINDELTALALYGTPELRHRFRHLQLALGGGRHAQ